MSEVAATPDEARSVIEAALTDYRTAYWNDDGSGMSLIDLLSPGPTVKEGQEELHLLADEVTVALSDAGLLVERDEAAELREAVKQYLAADDGFEEAPTDIEEYRKANQDFAAARKRLRRLVGMEEG